MYSELTMYRDAGCMLIYAGTSLRSAGKVVESIVHELRELVDHKVTRRGNAARQGSLKGSYVLGLESTSSRMGKLARQELYFKRFFSLDEMLERIERVTAEEVQKLAAAVLRSQAHGRGHARAAGRIPRAPSRICGSGRTLMSL